MVRVTSGEFFSLFIFFFLRPSLFCFFFFCYIYELNLWYKANIPIPRSSFTRKIHVKTDFIFYAGYPTLSSLHGRMRPRLTGLPNLADRATRPALFLPCNMPTVENVKTSALCWKLLKLVTGTRNGERGAGNGERGTENAILNSPAGYRCTLVPSSLFPVPRSPFPVPRSPFPVLVTSHCAFSGRKTF